MNSSPSSKKIALTSVFTALVYVTTSISIPMPKPLGVWHMGNLVSFIGAIMCGPYVGAIICGLGAGLFDVWNPLWGSNYIIYAPATFIIRGFMGFLAGKISRIETLEPRYSGLVAMIVGHVEKNIGYFLYDYYLFGALSMLDLFTFFPKSLVEVIITFGLIISIRRVLGKTYLL